MSKNPNKLKAPPRHPNAKIGGIKSAPPPPKAKTTKTQSKSKINQPPPRHPNATSRKFDKAEAMAEERNYQLSTYTDAIKGTWQHLKEIITTPPALIFYGALAVAISMFLSLLTLFFGTDYFYLSVMILSPIILTLISYCFYIFSND